MNSDEIRTLFAFNTWANHKMLAACQVLTAEEFSKDLHNSFGSVRGTLVHIMGAEWVWLQRWLGDSPRALFSQEAFPNLTSIESRWITLQQEQQAFIATLTDERLTEKLAYTNFKGQRFEYTIAHMIQHVVNHSSYHRGQIVTLLRQLGRPAPSTDLLLYIDEEPD